jgi:hypothetical protein
MMKGTPMSNDERAIRRLVDTWFAASKSMADGRWRLTCDASLLRMESGT